jgi:hypothetical protein
MIKVTKRSQISLQKACCLRYCAGTGYKLQIDDIPGCTRNLRSKYDYSTYVFLISGRVAQSSFVLRSLYL